MYLVNVTAQNLMSHPGNTQLLISPISVLRRPLNNLTRFLCQLHVFDIQENSRAELELDRLTCMDWIAMHSFLFT